MRDIEKQLKKLGFGDGAIFGVGVAGGVIVGAIAGSAYGNVGLGVGLGICFGAALASVVLAIRRGTKSDE